MLRVQRVQRSTCLADRGGCEAHQHKEHRRTSNTARKNHVSSAKNVGGRSSGRRLIICDLAKATRKWYPVRLPHTPQTLSPGQSLGNKAGSCVRAVGGRSTSTVRSPTKGLGSTPTFHERRHPETRNA